MCWIVRIRIHLLDNTVTFSSHDSSIACSGLLIGGTCLYVFFSHGSSMFTGVSATCLTVKLSSLTERHSHVPLERITERPGLLTTSLTFCSDLFECIGGVAHKVVESLLQTLFIVLRHGHLLRLVVSKRLGHRRDFPNDQKTGHHDYDLLL